MHMHVASLTITAAVLTSAGFASDWPQWRGPERTGVSAETGWGIAAQSEPLWRAELGNGHSSFAIAEGQVYTLGYDAERGVDVVYCLGAEDGTEVWRHEYKSEIWDLAHDGGTLTTPTIDGDVVYTTNREGKLFCFDRGTGAIRWSRDAVAEHEVQPHTWGFSCSPLIIDGMVIVNYGQVHAFDKKTGADLWHTETNFGFAYSTPAPFQHADRELLAVLCGNGCAVIDRTDGEELAFYEWIKNPQIYPMTPVVIGDRIFISAGYERGCSMLQFAGGDDGYALTPIWESRVMRNKMSGAVLYKDHLFGFDESILKCIDLDGKEKWRKRGFGTGAMSIVGDRLVIITGRGKVIVAEADPNEYLELSSQDVLRTGTYWSTPVLSNGLLYCRNSYGSTACLDFRTEDAIAANTVPQVPGALPAAEALIEKHLELIGGRERVQALSTVHLAGQRESLFNTVSTGAINVYWSETVGYEWNVEPDGEYGYRGDSGWSLDDAPRVLTGSDLFAEREVGDFKRFINLDDYYRVLETVDAVAFDNRDCYRVLATTIDGSARNLYFEAGTGFYAGLDGEGVDMWAFRDYRDTGTGLLLPMQWSLFDSETGEMETATFDDMTINGELPEDAIAPPEIIVLISRPADELAAANEALEKKYGETLFGEWKFTVRPMPEGAPPLEIGAENGLLAFLGPEGPMYMLEPDEDGVMEIVGQGIQLVIVYTEDDPTVIEALSVRAGPEEFDRLVR